MPPEIICLLSSPEPSRPSSASYVAANVNDLATPSVAFPLRKSVLAVNIDHASIENGSRASDSTTGADSVPSNRGKDSFGKTIAQSWSFVPQQDFMTVEDGNETLRLVAAQREAARAPSTRLASDAPGRRSGPDSIDLTNCPEKTDKPRAKRQKLNWDSEKDPFASSSPLLPAQPLASRSTNMPAFAADPKFKRAAKKRAGWDHISSSAPSAGADTDPFASSPRTLVRSHTDILKPASSKDDGLGDFFDTDSSQEDLPVLADLDVTKPRKVAKSTKTSKTRHNLDPARSSLATASEQKARDKAEKAAAREAEKARKFAEKERSKNERQIEREKAAALAEVNKVRTDKKASAPEMIVDLPSSLDAAIRLQVETLLDDLSVEYKSWSSPVDNVVKWRRKVAAIYREDAGHWEPAPLHVKEEEHVLVIMQALDFVQLVLGPEGMDLEAHSLKMRVQFRSRTIIYLIEGLTTWLRKNRNARNRHFTSAVRSGLEPAEDTSPEDSRDQPSSRRKKNTAQTQPYVDEDTIEEALLRLQIVHGAMIHHTTAPVETAQWIAILTQHISTIPYKKQKEASNDAAAAFCMESGQVRTGENALETYVRMLQEIVRVTAPIAYGIAEEFGSVTELVKALEEGGPLVLENVRKSANRDGALSDRTIGQAVSRRIYKIFTGRDETSTEV
jgi:crossover junction endonuclease EME1